jgi:hypothetical protein
MRSLSVRPAVAGDVKQQTLPRERLLLADIVAFAGLNTVANTGTYDVVSNNGIAGTSGSLFVNDGLFEKTGGSGVSEVTTNFINSGELNVLSGSIEFSGGFTNTGVIHGLVTESGGVTTVSAPVPSDFNGDALSDLLWRGTNGDAQIWESNGSGGFSDQDLGVVDNSYQIAATADFNGDGKSDMLWRNANGDAQIWNSMARAASPAKTWADVIILLREATDVGALLADRVVQGRGLLRPQIRRLGPSSSRDARKPSMRFGAVPGQKNACSSGPRIPQKPKLSL